MKPITVALVCVVTAAALLALRADRFGSPGAEPAAGSAHAPKVCEVVSPALTRIGSVAGQELESLLDGVEAARFLVDGGIALLNRNSQQVRVFESDGRFRKALGRRGAGPGELEDPISMDLLTDDSLAVWDWGQGRVMVFPIDDGEPRTVRLDPPPQNPDGTFGVGIGPHVFLLGAEPYSVPGRTPQEGNTTLNVLSYSAHGSLLDTLTVLPYGQRLWVDEARREAGQPWFQPRGLFRVRNGTLYTTTGDTAVVWATALRESGVDRLVTWDPSPREVRPEHLEAHRRATTERVRSNIYLAERMARVWNTMPSAERFPAVGDVRIDESDRVWIKEYDRPGEAGPTWRLLGADGQLICTARLIDSFQAFDFFQDRVVGLVRDAQGVEFLEIRRIVDPDR